MCSTTATDADELVFSNAPCVEKSASADIDLFSFEHSEHVSEVVAVNCEPMTIFSELPDSIIGLVF